MNFQLSEIDEHTDRCHLKAIVQRITDAGFSPPPMPHHRDPTKASRKKKDNGRMTGMDYLI